MNNFNMLSQFTFCFKYFVTNLTFEKFPSWTILICYLNLHFVSNILLQISHLKGSLHEQFQYVFSIYILFQIFHQNSHIWMVLIKNNFNMVSQFIFCFKYFTTNITFENFPSWTIFICFLNLFPISLTGNEFFKQSGWLTSCY